MNFESLRQQSQQPASPNQRSRGPPLTKHPPPPRLHAESRAPSALPGSNTRRSCSRRRICRCLTRMRTCEAAPNGGIGLSALGKTCKFDQNHNLVFSRNSNIDRGSVHCNAASCDSESTICPWRTGIQQSRTRSRCRTNTGLRLTSALDHRRCCRTGIRGPC